MFAKGVLALGAGRNAIRLCPPLVLSKAQADCAVDALDQAIGEIAKRNNTAASIVHSLPLVSLLTLIWLYSGTRDSALVARHMTGTFFFVLPTLPMLTSQKIVASPSSRVTGSRP